MHTPLQDPLGHTIHLPAIIDSKEGCSNYEDLKQVITAPSYIIEVKKKAIYFFRRLNEQQNLLVETIATEGRYLFSKCMVNPSEQYISSLLKKGGLVSLI
jgi:hypothetical protein